MCPSLVRSPQLPMTGPSTTGALDDPLPSCTFKHLSSRIILFLLHCQFLPLYRLIFIGYKRAITFPIFKSKTKKNPSSGDHVTLHKPNPRCHTLLHIPTPERVVSPIALPSLFSRRQTNPYRQFLPLECGLCGGGVCLVHWQICIAQTVPGT